MNLLKKKLEKLIPETQKEIKELINKKGDTQISTVSVAQAYSGLRGIKAFVCDTSSVSADKGLIIRGYPLLDIVNILPEEVFFLLLSLIVFSRSDQELNSKINPTFDAR